MRNTHSKLGAFRAQYEKIYKNIEGDPPAWVTEGRPPRVSYSWIDVAETDTAETAHGREAYVSIEDRDDGVHVVLDGPIDEIWGISTQTVMAELDQYKGKPLFVDRLNSPGGDAFEGWALYGYLSDWNETAKVTMHGVGLVGSAASMIFLVADLENRTLAPGTMYFIHGCQIFACVGGSRHDVKAWADNLVAEMTDLDKNIRGIYETRTGMDKKTIQEWTDDEKYLTRDEAIKLGIATDKKADKTDARQPDGDSINNNVFQLDEGLRAYLCAAYFGKRAEKKEDN